MLFSSPHTGQGNSSKYSETVKESVQLFACSDTATIYVPAALRAAILQWYHTSPAASWSKAHAGNCEREFLLAQTHHSQEVWENTLASQHKSGTLGRSACQPIGPWVVRFNSTSVPGKVTIEKIHALTAIDKATEWPEFLAIRNKSGYHISVIFDSQWLCRYT